MTKRSTPKLTVLRAAVLAIATLSLIVTLSLSKGAPQPALAAANAPPLLVSTRYILVYVDGEKRQTASAGPDTNNYRLLGTLADGSVLVSYYDAGMLDVETISPSLASRTLKTFQRGTLFVAPASDGFIAYDAMMQLMRRYDMHGSLAGPPIAPIGARDALGIGDSLVVIGAGRVAVWDRGGRLRHEILVNAGAIALMPNDRFVVTDLNNSEVRTYTTALDVVGTLRMPGRRPRALAAGQDGSLAVLTGTPSCLSTDVEVDVYDTATSEQPRARIRQNVGTAVALALDGDAVYVANRGCRGDGDGSIAVFGRDGTPRGIITNVGSPTGVVPLAAARR
jgi:DNA-binding beta-propeller fold protein YncE